MPILLPDKDAKCQACDKPMPPDGQSIRPAAWFHRDWTCRHGATWTCADCYGNVRQSCPQCGCQDEYT
jgi:hypothetical protein